MALNVWIFQNLITSFKLKQNLNNLFKFYNYFKKNLIIYNNIYSIIQSIEKLLIK